MSQTHVTRYPILSELYKEFLSKIKSYFVFGENGEQVITVTNDENVYAFGESNRNGCLGLGHRDPVKKPTKIEELCQKCVVDIQFGGYGDIVLALTRNSEVFSWGSSVYGLLGVGHETIQSLSPILIEELLDKNVTDIRCGRRQCLALTLFGELYYWGHHNEFKPKLMLRINGENIKSVTCGADHLMALTDDGKVYSWGHDRLESDTGRNSYIQFPRIVNVSTRITKIQCGPSHSLMLSSDGDIYSFGYNPYNICGERRQEDSLIKLKISNKFIDIGATKHYSISVGLSKDGYCYIWGDCGTERIDTPSKTRFTAIIDVLEYCSKIKVTFDRSYYESNYTYGNNISISTNKFSEMFNIEEFSDTAFKIGDNFIYAHKSILKCVCKHFDVMFSSDYWRECNAKVIEITQYSYAVYYAFIEYLYTNVVNVKPEDAIELLDLANAYLEDELKRRCFEIIRSFVSLDI